MKRSTVLLLALALLLAHSLAIYHDLAGVFANPPDSAHVAFRLARNAVHTGSPAFNLGESNFAAHPSPLWVLLCTGAEALAIPVTRFAQTLSMLCALGSVVLVAQFSRERLAGVIAPLLLVVNGSLAACAADGTERALLALLGTGAFLAYERRRPLALGLLLCAAVATRMEGALLAGALLAFELLRLLRPARPAPPLWRAFAAPALLLALLAVARLQVSASLWSPDAAALVSGDGARLLLGVAWLWDQARIQVTPLLVCVPLLLLLLGKLGGHGLRALLLALGLACALALQGGDARPMGSALVPALPLLFLAVQDAFTRLLDGQRPYLERAIWTVLLTSSGLSALASKLPGNLGPLPALAWIESSIRPSPEPLRAFGISLGRRGLQDEIKSVAQLRSLGLFLRERVASDASILTPYPGALGYLSRKLVFDLLGRATPLAPGAALLPWCGEARADVLLALQRKCDYVVPGLSPNETAVNLQRVAELWLERFDSLAELPGRKQELLTALEAYELICVPIPYGESLQSFAGQPCYLLRRRAGAGEPARGPSLELLRNGRELVVLLRHRGPPQIADLLVEYVAPESEVKPKVLHLRPTGEFEEAAQVRARRELLLFASGGQGIELLRVTLPAELQQGKLRAALLNPGQTDIRSAPPLGEPVIIDL